MNITLDIETLEMPLATSKKNDKLEKAMSLVNLIDLSMVKMKLMDEEEGQAWSKEYCDYAEQLYKRYLCMIYIDPDGPHVPTKVIDLFWHQHILDTRAYAKDCSAIFGEFLHHFPYFGMRGEEDAKNLHDSFEETKVIYYELFGEDYCDESSACNKCSCSSSCGVGKCSSTE